MEPKKGKETEQGFWVVASARSGLQGEDKFEGLGDSDVVGVEVEETGEQKSGNHIDSDVGSLGGGLSDHVWTSVIIDDSVDSPENGTFGN